MTYSVHLHVSPILVMQGLNSNEACSSRAPDALGESRQVLVKGHDGASFRAEQHAVGQDEWLVGHDKQLAEHEAESICLSDGKLRFIRPLVFVVFLPPPHRIKPILDGPLEDGCSVETLRHSKSYRLVEQMELPGGQRVGPVRVKLAEALSDEADRATTYAT